MVACGRTEPRRLTGSRRPRALLALLLLLTLFLGAGPFHGEVAHAVPDQLEALEDQHAGRAREHQASTADEVVLPTTVNRDPEPAAVRPPGSSRAEAPPVNAPVVQLTAPRGPPTA